LSLGRETARAERQEGKLRLEPQDNAQISESIKRNPTGFWRPPKAKKDEESNHNEGGRLMDTEANIANEKTGHGK